MSEIKRPKIGLALGSGGSKGLAHIGVIKILEKNNVPIDFIAGSSIGSLIGGFYAATKDISAIEELALSSSWHQLIELLLDPSLKRGLIKGEKVQDFIRKRIGHKNFSDLKIPFTAVTTDLVTGYTVTIKEGEILQAIRASISVPLVFEPVEMENWLLVDGGISEPVPVKTVREMGADLVIAVNLDVYFFAKDTNHITNLYKLSQRALNILRYHLAQHDIEGADLVIAPEIATADLIGWQDFIHSQKNILRGEEAMLKELHELQNLISIKSKQLENKS
jgi:NTE family protein